MQQALVNLLNLIRTEIIAPLQVAFDTTSWVPSLLRRLNVWLNSIFNIFREVDTQTEIVFIDVPFFAQILGILVLILFISILVKIFKYSFLTLEKIYSSMFEIPKETKTTTWRKQWKRKK